jgi:hypothetical protein
MRGTHDSVGALPSSKVGSRAVKHVCRSPSSGEAGSRAVDM